MTPSAAPLNQIDPPLCLAINLSKYVLLIASLAIQFLCSSSHKKSWANTAQSVWWAVPSILGRTQWITLLIWQPSYLSLKADFKRWFSAPCWYCKTLLTAILAPAVVLNHFLLALKQGLVGCLPTHWNVEIRTEKCFCGQVCSSYFLLRMQRQMVHEEEGSRNGA